MTQKEREWLMHHQLRLENKPIHKFNGGKGATLCHNCSVIIKEKLTDDLLCIDCKWEILDEVKGLICNWEHDCNTKHEPMHYNKIKEKVNEI